MNDTRQYRKFEIRKLFYILRNHYIQTGLPQKEAEQKTYDDIGIRFCLKKSSIRHDRDSGARCNEQNFELKETLRRLKKIIEIVEKQIE